MKENLLGLALAGILAASSANAADMMNDEAGKEKCYGIAKAGMNDCKAADGSHSCKGQSKKDNNANDWMLVEKGKCAEMGGKTEAPAAAPKKS